MLQLEREESAMPPQRRYSPYSWPFQMLMDLWERWTIRSQEKRNRDATIKRLNEREDRGLPPDETWEKWR